MNKSKGRDSLNSGRTSGKLFMFGVRNPERGLFSISETHRRPLEAKQQAGKGAGREFTAIKEIAALESNC